MKRLITLIIGMSGFISANSQTVNNVISPVDYVNPLMGTDSRPSLSNGNTYPAIALPWGMNFWTPQTGRMGDGWQYTYDAEKIRGFKQTHQPSPWINDYGQFAIMPVTGKAVFDQNARASWFSHKTEIATPYYYSVYLADHDVTTEITPTERAARFRFTFPKTDSAFVVVDALNGGSYIKIIPEENKIIGFTQRYASGKLINFKNYFVIKFDKPFSINYGWHDSTVEKTKLEVSADHAGALVGFSIKRIGEQVNAKVASSFISSDQAEQNLKEIGNDNFETIKAKGKVIWNKTLGKLLVAGGSVDQVRTFYSCLYRMLFFPNKLYEIDASGKPIHWSLTTEK